MMQQQPAPLSSEGKRKLATQLAHATRLDTGIQLFEGWDRATALATLVELHRDAETLAPKTRTNYRLYLGVFAVTSFMSMVLWGFENWATALVINSVVPLFLYSVHRATASEKGVLREQIKKLFLEVYLPSATPSDLPWVLEIGALLGSPDAHPPLKETLIRLLPFFSESMAAHITPAQHKFLLRLLPTADEELLVGALLALGTLGDPRDADHVRFTASGLSLRVREAKLECLALLEKAG